MWTMVRLSGYCGLRQGECLALVPENIDRLRRRIRVEASPQLPASYAGFGDARGGIVLRHDVSERG
jgi:integrase